MITPAARTCAAQLQAHFVAHGAQIVQLPILQDAELLLDLYGEDIRARSYVTSDAVLGEQMLRPDFTVPVVQMHMAAQAGPARYTYAGEVFRRQDDHPDRPSEYLQAGFEILGEVDAAAADAQVFAIIAQALAPLGLRPTMGDVGLLMAAVGGLDTPAPRRAALMRHIWRPQRFRALLDAYAGHTPMSAARQALLAHSGPMQGAGATIGLRTPAQIAARIADLRADAMAAPISPRQVAALSTLLGVRTSVPGAIKALRALQEDLPAIAPAIDGLEARAQALAAHGIALDDLDFDASYGRSSMEYYDGFVFGFYTPHQPDLPAIASGGRYDALTARLGAAGAPPVKAVGCAVRPGLVARLGSYEALS